MRGMHVHDLPFGFVQLVGLVEDGVAGAELADVVQQRGTLEPASPLGSELQLLRDSYRERASRARCARGCRDSWSRPLFASDPAEGRALRRPLRRLFNLTGRMDVENGQRSSIALVSMAAIKDAISIVAKLQKLSETA
jgi:hypothetical protein